MKRKFKIQPQDVQQGFTLVEILTVVAVLAIIGTLFVIIFTRTLRGSNKSQIILSIKQNGQSVLESMDKTIRNSKDVICVSTPNNTVVVKNNDGKTNTRYRFIPPRNGGDPRNGCMSPADDISKASNGCIVFDNPTQQIPSESDVKLFITRICNPTDPMPQANFLTDTNKQSGVSVKSGSFTRNIAPGSKDLLTISFALSAGVEAPVSITGQIDPVTFQTTVELR